VKNHGKIYASLKNIDIGWLCRLSGWIASEDRFLMNRKGFDIDES
jgi:hypothetical protein